MDVKPVMYCDADAKKLIIQRAAASTAKIYTTNGIMVKEFEVTSDNASIDIAGLSKGIYLCRLEFKTKVMTGKVIL